MNDEARSHRRPDAFDARLAELARTPVLLIASDYDGTLSPIVDDPAQARPDRDAIVALGALAAMSHTHVTIISGRSLRDLATLTGAPQRVHLVGSHGSEFDPDFAATLPDEARVLRTRVSLELADIAASGAGLTLEEKPASIAFHYRNADEETGKRAVERVLAGPARHDGVYVKHGKMVVELGVVAADKGAALHTMRQRLSPSAAIFFGDDRTDEDAFARLSGPDVGVKVGPGDSVAEFRVGGTREVARRLAQLAEFRAAWLAGADAVPIEDHSLLSDQRALGLVAPDARITWLCVPRIDSPALFAELLGGPPAGYFSVRPVADDDAPPEQRYVGASFHLQTKWPTLTVTDYLDCSSGRSGQRPGRSDLLRELRGFGRVRVEFAPRLDFGRVATRLDVRDGGLAVLDTVDPIVLYAPGLTWTIEEEGANQTAWCEFDLDGQTRTLELRYGTGNLAESGTAPAERSEETRLHWASWAARLQCPPLATDAVRRSALVLKGLSHGPTGAIAAAGTTSLPEGLGGVRNWDYRYCWPRDAALAAAALVRLGSTSEALAFLDWLLGVVDTLQAPERLRPLYTVNGAELGSEAEIPELGGYAGSRPVRVGNAAAGQLQLDVFGPIVELIHLLAERDAPLSGEHFRLVEAMVGAVEARWRDPDHGIWEVRGPMRHHVHSKVMCWETARRGVDIAERLAGAARPEWAALRDAIREDVLAHGIHPSLGAFTAAYGEDVIDAAVLAVGLKGLVEADDSAFQKTVEAVERRLLLGDTVYRYRFDDGLPGEEGGFHLCTSWLIQAYVKVGRADDANALFEELLAGAGATGLMPEEVDPETGRGLGNHPQAYTHLGVIEAALALAGGETAGPGD